MNQSFDLPVTYNGKELLFPAKLLILGCIYKIEVEVFESAMVLERDEERNWRAMLDPNASENKELDPGLVQAILKSIEAVSNV